MACSGMSSAGFPTGLQGRMPRLNQRTSITTCFPLPSTGQTLRSPGGFTAHLQLSKSSTDHSCMQAEPEVIARLSATGQVVNPGSPAEFAAALADQRAAVAAIGEILGIKPAQ